MTTKVGPEWTRRDRLLEIQRKYQREWEESRVFEADAPLDASKPPKFFITFPYPYMNGKLHLGHGFSFSKAEFCAGYQRLKGKRTLLPFGLHITGMPIAACAQKLRNEMAQYGNPPVFPVDDDDEEAPKKPEPTVKSEADKAIAGKFVGKKLKKAANKPQWLIMRDMGYTDEQIAAFSSADQWIKEFPPKALEDLRIFGARVDYRRSFVTTEVNPFYDSFIRWQFRKLRAADLLEFGKRFTIYSPADGQPCQDHDRSSGEGVQPQEYTLIKLAVQRPLEQPCFAPHSGVLGGRKVVLLAATLRPETMFGQTNCWILPSGEYGAYELSETEVVMCVDRAARNLAWQHVLRPYDSTPKPLFTLKGEQMMGLPLSAGNAILPTVYTLPMLTIKTDKGTGIVTSVPSDAPDDYQALMDLKNKPDFRKKLGVKDEWVMPFDVIPIIEIPGYGNQAAATLCQQMKIQSQKDAEKLAEAKNLVYLKGFNEGVLITENEWKGVRVKDAKPLIRKMMIEKGLALSYSEPESRVISRSGDECVVALTDQWYIKYGSNPEWKQKVADHVASTLECYTTGTRRGFEETVGWLTEWACSRTFGLGTKLPFPEAEKFVIDSLSDSTIYMAYYTIAHFLQGPPPGQTSSTSVNLDGQKPGPYGITPQDLTDEVWDFIFLGKGDAAKLNTKIPADILKRMRAEFEYWYPMDLRCSGKDLIQNHLTMCLYNHAAIFPPHHWPRSIFCNGHILVDGEKMAKSKGNFMTLRQCIEDYSTDPIRLAFADAGDSLDDANFVLNVVNAQILKLTKEMEWSKEILGPAPAGTAAPREGELTFFDRVFATVLDKAIVDTDKHYAGQMFRDAIQTCWFGLQNARDEYRSNCASAGQTMHIAVLRRFVEVQALLLSPICPHFCEYIWREVLNKPTSIHLASFPEPSAPVDVGLLMAAEYLQDTLRTFRAQIMKQAKKATDKKIENGVIFVVGSYSELQVKTIKIVYAEWVKEGCQIPADLAKRIQTGGDPELVKDFKRVMGFVAYLKEAAGKFGEKAFQTTPAVPEKAILESNLSYLKQQLGLSSLTVHDAADPAAPDDHKLRGRCEIGRPVGAFWG